MKHHWPILLLLVCLLNLSFSASGQDTEDPPAEANTIADQSADAPPSLESLLNELTQASLASSLGVLQQLESVGGRDLLPLFQALLDGDLYFHGETLQIFRLQEGTPDGDVGFDILSGEALGSVVEWPSEKMRINNRLRSFLRDAIARIQLMDGSDRQRLQAARNILSDINEDSVALLATARDIETDAGVLGVIEAGLAMYRLQSSDDEQTRVAALNTLSGRLENQVRIQITALLDPQRGNEQNPAVRDAAERALASIENRVEFFQFMEQVFFGLSLGSVLLLAAIGLAVTFGVMGVINMAHGEMIMLGAYTTFVIQQVMPNLISWSIIVAIPAAFLVSACVGMFIQRYVIRFLNGRPLETLLATFGISLILQQAVRTIFSPLNRRVISPEWLSGSLQINPVWSVTYNRLYILIFALIIFLILLIILRRTSLGLNVRAVSQNRNMAMAMGIRTDLVDALTFGLGSGIAGIAGVALSQLTNVGPNLGQSYIIDSFMVVVFGGVGNLLGTLVGAFSLGMFSKFLEPVTGAVLANILVLVLIILFIQKRPKGMFPQRGRAAE